jgi:hypothetical protein
VFWGLAIVAGLVGWLFTVIVEHQKARAKEAFQKQLEEEDKALDEFAPDIYEYYTFISPPTWDLMVSAFSSFALIVCTIAVGCLFFGLVTDDFNTVDAIYISTMTITTVGLGDIVPSNINSRVFTIFYGIFGTVATAKALGILNDALERYQMSHREAQVLQDEVNDDLFKDVTKTLAGSSIFGGQSSPSPSDADATITKSDYILYKLSKMGLVDEDIVGRLEHQFFKLNKTRTGVLTRDDIIEFNAKTCKLMGVQYRKRTVTEVKELTGRKLAYAAKLYSSSFSLRGGGSHRVAPHRKSFDEFGDALAAAIDEEIGGESPVGSNDEVLDGVGEFGLQPPSRDPSMTSFLSTNGQPESSK